jgi:hypothetical protein
MSSRWESVDINSLTPLEDLLTEEEYLQLRYLACHLVAQHKSNDGLLVAYVTWRVLKQWGYKDAIIVPALKRTRKVATVDEANKIVNRVFTDPDPDRVEAAISFVVIHPSVVIAEDGTNSKKILFPAITDLFMTPELDVPIYCMHKRNTLSPLATIPEVKVSQIALLHDPDDEVTRTVRQKMSLDERRMFDELCGIMQSSDPWRGLRHRVTQKDREDIEQLILTFSKPFTPETRPNEEFFRFFQLALDRLKTIADVDFSTGKVMVK